MMGFGHVFSGLPAISSTVVYTALVFLTTALHASAQSFLGPLGESCEFRKTQGVIIKLLAVYASHVLTIKLSPGQRLYNTLQDYAIAALLPSSSAYVALLDLTYRKSNFSKLMSDTNITDKTLYKNMQKAINAGAVCRRVKNEGHNSLTNPLLDPHVRAKPLQQNEDFVMVRRGTYAGQFAPMKIEGDSQPMKALVGAIQLGFATLQLASATDPQVAAYGYGAYVYTIIPYAIGSFINLIGALLTRTYVDLTEMELSESAFDEEERWPEVRRNLLYAVVFLELAVYFAIVGGITHFRPGISSQSQRGWFLMWAVYGIGYGFIMREGHLKSLRSFEKHPHIHFFLSFLLGAGAIGGVVKMIQQYLHLFHC